MKPLTTIPHIALSTYLFLFCAAGCKSEKTDLAGKAVGARTQWIDPAKLAPGPIRHPTLTATQMERVRTLQRTFAEVDPSPLEEWVEDFKREQDPERELRIYEAIAGAYRTYCQGRSLSPRAKAEVYGVLLLRSGAPDAEVLPQLKLEELSVADAKDILRLYKLPPEPVAVTPSPAER